MKEINLLLYNIRSVHNVASIFRSADAAGVSCVYLAGVTPGPTDRFARQRSDFAKVSLGTEKTLPHEKIEDVQSFLTTVKHAGFKIIALEQHPSSVDYRSALAALKTLVILGEEVRGVPPEILAEADEIAMIPMQGSKESLNVSVAAGIFLFHLIS